MKKKEAKLKVINRITGAAVVLYLGGLAALSFRSWTWADQWWLILAAGILGLMVGGVPLLLYNRQMKRFFHQMNFCMDEMLNLPAQISFPRQEDPETVMARFQEKLERIYLLLKETENKTRQENEKLQGLISDISHQTKTPLTNLKMYLAILADEALDEQERKEFRELSEFQAEKLEFLIQSLIKLSRMETGVFQLVPTTCDFYQTLADAAGSILLEAERKEIDIEIQCPESLLVKHDRKWTAEALFNILENAVKYTEAGGKIRVSAEQWESFIKVDICDNGMGIAEEIQGRIFQRFYRAPEAAQQKGAGIGLYIAREVIERHRGYITVHSELGKGCCFSVFLPVS